MRELAFNEVEMVSGGAIPEEYVEKIYYKVRDDSGTNFNASWDILDNSASNFSWYNVAREVVEWGTALGVYVATKNAPAAGASGIAAANLLDATVDATVNAYNSAWGSHLTNVDNQVRQGALRSGWNAEAGVP